MGKEWVALEGFDNSDHAIVATDSQVIALGNVMSEDNSRALADSGENGQENSALKGLGFIDDDKRIVERSTANMGKRENFNETAIHNLFDDLV